MKYTTNVKYTYRTEYGSKKNQTCLLYTFSSAGNVELKQRKITYNEWNRETNEKTRVSRKSPLQFLLFSMYTILFRIAS